MLFQLKVLDENVNLEIFYLRFFRNIKMSAPSRKTASFELAPPYEVPKLNQRRGRSLGQIR